MQRLRDNSKDFPPSPRIRNLSFRRVREAHPLRMMVLHPLQDATGHIPQELQIIRKEDKTERQHPEAENGEDAEHTAQDEQQARRNSCPTPGRLPQPAHGFSDAGRQASDQQLQPPLPVVVILGRTTVHKFTINTAIFHAPMSPQLMHRERGSRQNGMIRSRKKIGADHTQSQPRVELGTVIRHREVGRHHVIVLARGARIVIPLK